MKIASAQLQMASSHSSLQQYEASESLQMWVGQRRSSAQAAAPQPAPATDTVTLSDAAGGGASAGSISDGLNSAIEHDPRLRLIRSMLEFLTGRAVRVFDATELQSPAAAPAATDAPSPPASAQAAPPQAAGYGIEYERHQSYTETEQTRFSASGTVQTADGRSIAFSLSLSMNRSYHETSDVSLRLGDAAKKTDPLVINFAGNTAQLTDQRFAFDLNSDGTATEQINFVSPGSGFLVFDRNHDGIINNGSELFGPAKGDGFAELAALDGDKNGWIDENDGAYGQLQVWSRDADGNNRLQSLAAAGVGAISLSRIATPFDIKNDANGLLGQIRQTGIVLQEDGSAGTIQQIDLTA
ncbi:MAG: VCBS repeat-containing protein [Bacteroidota bacterium]